MLAGIFLIIIGALAAYPAIVKASPESQGILDKIAKYQKWIGLFSVFWGAWGILNALLNLGWLSAAPIWFITALVASCVNLGIGYILAYDFFKENLFKEINVSEEKAMEVKKKLMAKQTLMGYIAIAIGVWALVASFMFAV